MDNRKLSEEAGLDPDVYTWNQIQLERFAELVAAAALAQPEQEPVGQLCEEAFGRGQIMWFKDVPDDSLLYTAPPSKPKEWVSLTDEEITEYSSWLSGRNVVKAIEQRLKEKNT